MEDDWGDDPTWNDSGPSLAKEDDGAMDTREYDVLDPEDLKAVLKGLEDSVTEALGVSRPVASALLRAYRWNSERLIEEMFDGRQKVLNQAGIAPPAAPLPALAPAVPCEICREDVPAAGTFALGCGHRFCLGCWDAYLADRVGLGEVAVMTRCPGVKCPMAVTDDVVLRLLRSPDLRRRYEDLVVASMVSGGRMFRWCPSARCGRVVRAESASVTSVRCTCGRTFCFRCGEDGHAPATCDMVQQWLAKCAHDSDNAHWMIANTKKCPICQVRIEKNQGCNHMVCRSCKHEFCWVCTGPWSEHGNATGGFYRCHKFSARARAAAAAAAAGEQPGAQAGAAAPAMSDEAQAEMDRYLHYYQRFHNQHQGMQFAEKQLLLTQTRTRDMQEVRHGDPDSPDWADTQFLMVAAQQVIECRMVLKYTYVFGYYLPNGPEKDLFEFMQQELEKTTEHLSELSEQPPEDVDRSQVLNLTRVTRKFMQNLLDGVAGGLTSDAQRS